MKKVKVKKPAEGSYPYYGSKATSGAFISPFPRVRAESRIHGGGEKITEDDARSKKVKRTATPDQDDRERDRIKSRRGWQTTRDEQDARRRAKNRTTPYPYYPHPYGTQGRGQNV